MRLIPITHIQLQTKSCHLQLQKPFPTSNCFSPCLSWRQSLTDTTHILGFWVQDTQPHGWHKPCCWRRPRTEQVDDNKMDWPDKRWAAKQHKLSTPSLRACLISPAPRLLTLGIHFQKFSSFLTVWKILPEILGCLQAMGGSRGAARVDKWLRSRLEAETTAAKKQISREEQGREGMNKKKKKKENVLVNFVWLFEPLPDTRASHLNLTHFSFAFCSSPLREHKAEEVGIYGLQPFPSVSPCYFQRFSI